MDELRCVVVSGPFADTHWGQAYIVDSLFAVVEITCLDAVSMGAHIATQLHECLQKTPVTLGQLHSDVRAITDANPGVSIVVGYIHDRKLSLTSVGQNAVVVVRTGSAGVVLSGNSSGSGAISPGDTIFFLNPAARNAISPPQLENFGTLVSIDEVREACGLELHKAAEETSGSAALVIRIGEVVSPLTSKKLGRILVDLVRYAIVRMALITGWLKPIKISSVRTIIATKRGRLILLSVIGALFIISVIGGLRFNSSVKTSTAVTGGLEKAQHYFEQGMALMQLNPVRSRETLSAAHDELEKLGALQLSGRDKKEILALSMKIDEGLHVAKRLYEIEPKPSVDLSLVKEGGWGDEFALWEDEVIILDRRNQAVYQLSLEGKSATLILGRDYVKDAQHIALHGNTVYLQGKAGIARFTIGEKMARPLRDSDVRWGTIARMVSFGGNVYLLDTAENQIWKYSEQTIDSGDTHTYLAPDVFPDLNKSISLAIDGSVWISKENTILKFTYGAPQSFTILGLDEPLADGARVYTNDDLANLYILDAAHKRIVVSDKSGIYMAQYVYSPDMAIADFIVSEEYKKILLLVGSLVYEVALQ